MPYIKLSVTTHSDHVEGLSEALVLLDALSVSYGDAEDEPLFQLQPDETPLWHRTEVEALFAETVCTDFVIAELKKQNPIFSALHFSSEVVADQDWVTLSQKQFQSQQYGSNLWIAPAWEEVGHLSGVIVKIDPGLAFGTGAHATTRLCLEWLADNPPRDKTVIDYGCGSGILALAALALGAQKVWAVDHDSQALIATENNAKLNVFSKTQSLIIFSPEQCDATKVDLVIANILANPLIELSPLLTQYLQSGGLLVLSGILDNEIDSIAHVYEKKFKRIDTKILEGWARLVLQRF